MPSSATERRRVILLHGPPASGKLTIARRLAAELEAVVLHNHLTFNLARTLYEIGDQRLLNLHRQLRLVMLDHALAPTPADARPVPDIILTLVYTEPDSVDSITEIIRRVDASGAELLPFFLQCSEQTLLERVAAPGREKEGKLHTPARLRALLAEKHYPPLPDPRTRIIANDSGSPEPAAAAIMRHLEPDPAADVGPERDLDR
jgi:hypothetical protein